MNPYPEIEFTIDFSNDQIAPLNGLPDYLIQHSTWTASNHEAENINAKQGRVYTFYGSQALYVKELVDNHVLSGTYVYGPFPKINNVSPSSDYISGNGFITVTGENLLSVRQVNFGSKPAQWFVAENDNTLVTSEFPVSQQQNTPIRLISNKTTTKDFQRIYKRIAGTGTSYATPMGVVPEYMASYGGKVWVNDQSGTPQTFSVTTNGTFTAHPLPTRPFNMKIGPDGFLYIPSGVDPVIYKLATDGTVVRTYNVGVTVNTLGIGPDGNLWCGTIHNQFIKLDIISGDYISYPIHGVGFCNREDGLMQVTTYPDETSLTVNTQGEVLNTTTFPGTVFIEGQVSGPDGNIWLADAYGLLWKLTLDGTLTSYAIGSSTPDQLIIGPDGNIWISDISEAPGGIWKVLISDPTDTTLYLSGTAPSTIIIGPDGNLWVSDLNNFIWKVI